MAPVVVASGDEAVEIFREEQAQGKPFDVAILNLCIRGGVGAEKAILSLRAINPTTKAIVTSGFANHDVMTNYVDYGFDGTLSKPYTSEKIVKCLRAVLE